MYKIFLILLCCFISSFSVEVTIYGDIYAKAPFKPSFTVVVSQQGKTDATIYTNQGSSLPNWFFKSDWPTSRWPSDPLPNDTFSWGKVSASREGYVITPAIRYYSVSIDHNMSGQDFNAVDTMDPVIRVDSPAAGEIIILNSPDPTDYGRIVWCGVDNSRLCMRRDYYVSYNNGKNYTLIKTIDTDIPCPGNNLPYERVKHVFDTVSDSCLVKIMVMDFDSNTGMDCSGIFRVVDTVRPTITVSSPNGGEKWYTGQTHNITWTASDNVTLTSRSIYYSNNNGTSWNLMDSSGNAGFTLPWVLSCTPSNQYKIKIKVFDQSGNNQEDISDNVFEIIDTAAIDTTKPVVKIIFPTAGSTLTLGKMYDIMWSATDNRGVVSIAIYRRWNNPGWILMDSSRTNTGSWPWYIQNGIDLSGFELRLTAYDSLGNYATDYSGKFDIKDLTPPIVSVKHPQKGKKYTYMVRINFSASYFCSALNDTDKWNRVVSRAYYYSLDGGNNYTFLDSLADTLNQYFYDESWYTKSLSSENAKIRVYVYDSKGNRGIAYSDSLFTITPPVSAIPYILPKKFEVTVLKDAIRIGMEKAGKVSISLYDLKGRRIWVREEVLSVGYHRINKRPKALGLYILRVVRADKSLRIKYVEVY